MKSAKAKFSSGGNDLYWRYLDMQDGQIRWIGYDDANWWNNAATTDQFRRKVGASGRVYTLDPDSDTVTIDEATSAVTATGDE